VTLCFEVANTPLEVTGYVVRFTPDGFAIEFDSDALDEQARRTIVHIASIVPARSRDAD